MANPKVDSSLNLALEISPYERDKSEELAVGYDSVEDTWEIIVKYSGDLNDILAVFPEITIVPTQTEYAIINLPQSLIEPLSQMYQIEYIEKPMRLFASLNQAVPASCIYRGEGKRGMTGQGVIVAVVDSGSYVKLMSS